MGGNQNGGSMFQRKKMQQLARGQKKKCNNGSSFVVQASYRFNINIVTKSLAE